MNYLYNWHEAPNINTVWTDKSTFHHAVMFVVQKSMFDTTLVRFLFLLNQPMTIGTANMMISGGGAVACYKIEGEGNEWQYVSTTDTVLGDTIKCEDFTIAPSSASAWASHPIYYEDDTLYLAASDPIPVGSAPEVEPKSFMAGWRMGQFIRGMRG